MGKLKKCKFCGADVAKSANNCPNCGAKLKNPVLGAIFVVIGILILISAFGGFSDEPKEANTINRTASSEPAETTKVEKTSFGVGESAELRDVIVTLNSVTESKGSQFNKPSDGNVFLICEFTIENNSSSDLGVSSIASFEAYVDDFAVNMSLVATVLEKGNKNQLDGAVAAGKKMNGVVGYEAPSDYKNLEIRFTPNVWSEKDIKFVYSK